MKRNCDLKLKAYYNSKASNFRIIITRLQIKEVVVFAFDTIW